MSRIDDLERGLYSRTNPGVRQDVRPNMTTQSYEPKSDWDDSDIKTPNKGRGMLSGSKLFHWFFIAAFAFFLVSASVALYIFYSGYGVVSPKNVDIRVVGPVSIAGGEELSLDIAVENHNEINLESAELFIEYPSGTRSSDGTYQEITRVREPLGSIVAGGVVRKTYRSILFGQQDELKDIKITVEYRVENSSATYEKIRNYDVTIGSAPLLLTVEYPTEVQSAQDFELKLTLASNSRTKLDNLILRAELPFGFTLTGSEPALLDGSVWSIGSLEPEAQRTLVLRGRLQAQDNEERSFKFNAGVRSGSNEKMIQTELVSDLKTIAVKSPSLVLSARINGNSSSEYVANVGRDMSVDVEWFNTLPTSIRDARIELAFSGALDRNSVIVNDGFFRSVDNTIVWDPLQNSQLKEIPPGGRGTVRFRFNTQAQTSSRSPEVSFSVNMTGTRFSGQNIPEQVVASMLRKISLQTNANVYTQVVHFDGPFANTGPIPPRADTPTTYTVVWTVANSFNEIASGQVRARLPTYVSWIGKSDPANETISYNNLTREVTWDLGTIAAGAGTSAPFRTVSFQVSILPSLSQVGSTPVLVEQQVFSGRDRFTNTDLSQVLIPLTTSIRQDSKYRQGMDNVTR